MPHKIEQIIVKRRVFNDTETGREIWQVSPDGCANEGPYIYQKLFTADDRFLFYTSHEAKRSFLCRLELATGLTARIAYKLGPGRMQCSIHPAGKEIFLIEQSGCRAFNIESFEERIVFRAKNYRWMRKPSGALTFTNDGEWFSFVFTDTRGKRGIARARPDGSTVKDLYRYTSDILHLQICPTDPDLLIFCQWPDNQNDMKIPQNQRARTMLLDARLKEALPYLMVPKGFRATHEFWSPDGKRIYYHKKTQPGWLPTWLSYMNCTTGEHTDYFKSDDIMLGHSCLSPDMKKVVSDCQCPKLNQLILVTIERRECEVLCWTNSSITGGHPEMAHVHPTFSQSGNYIVYTSDVTGEPQVYVVPL
jgi:hypothetical protein